MTFKIGDPVELRISGTVVEVHETCVTVKFDDNALSGKVTRTVVPEALFNLRIARDLEDGIDDVGILP
jgi:hypothetical protein